MCYPVCLFLPSLPSCFFFFFSFFFFLWDHLTTPSIVYLWFSPEPLPVEAEVSFCMTWGSVFFHILKHKMFPYGRILLYIFNVVNSLRALLSAGSQLFQCVPPGRSSVVCGSLQVPSWWACLRKQHWGLCGRAGSWPLIFVQGTPSTFPVWQGPGNLRKIKTAEAEGKKKKPSKNTDWHKKWTVSKKPDKQVNNNNNKQTTQNRRDNRWQKSRIGLDLEKRE